MLPYVCVSFTSDFCETGGYPDNPGDSPANPGGISKRDCVIIPGFSHVLCFAFRTDNSGPPVNIQVCA